MMLLKLEILKFLKKQFRIVVLNLKRFVGFVNPFKKVV